MKEFIEREALIKEGWFLQRTVYGNGSATIESKQLKDIPTADVVPVVRCKDCKHSKGACIDLWGKPAIECITGRTHSRDWFCADGKRKGGDE